MRPSNKSDETGQKKRRVGRPVIQIDMDLVEDLAALNCTDAEIAATLRVSLDTIIRRKKDTPEFLEALEAGRSRGRMSLRRLQWQSALGGSVPMQIFLGKNLLGQRDKFDEKVAEDNQPLPW